MIGLGTAAIGRPQYINIRENSNVKTFNKTEFSIEGKVMLTQAYQKGILLTRLL